jgi:hypothetical protein
MSSVELTRGDAAVPAQAQEITSLVEMAIREKVPVEVLERLVALQERVTERNARAAFFEAVSSFQEECPEIRKSKTAQIATRGGTKYSYTYAPLEEITRTIRPALKRNGLSYSWDVSVAEGKVLVVTAVLRHIDGHSERASFPVPVDTAAAMSDAQKNGAALTYGRRQSLIAVLGLTTADEDLDGVQGQRPEREVVRLTEAQVADLDALIDDVGANRAKFLRWLGVERLSDIAQTEYDRAIRALEEKRSA